MPSRRAAGLWHHPQFMRLWTGQTISLFGSVITREALPLAAVLVLGAGPLEMGLLAAVSSAPVVLVGLLAGVAIDRWPRRTILIAADLGRALLLASLPVTALLGHLHIAQLFVIAMLAGVLTVFFDVAYLSVLPTLLRREELLDGNSKLAISSAAAEVAAPGIGGVLVQAITAPSAILVDAVSFLASAVCIASIRVAEPAVREDRPASSVPRDALRSLGVVFGDPLLRGLAGSAATLSLFGNMIGTLYALYAIRELGLAPAVLGLLIASGGLGELAGALVAGRVARRIGPGAALIGSLLVIAGAQLLIPLARGPLLVAGGCLLVGQVAGDAARSLHLINAISVRQLVTPDRLLGRTNAAMQFLAEGVAPVGALLGGVLGGAFGLRPTLTLVVLGPLAAGLWLVCSPVRGLTAERLP